MTSEITSIIYHSPSFPPSFSKSGRLRPPPFLLRLSRPNFPVRALGALLALEAALLVAAGGEALPAVRLREATAQKVGVLEHAL